MAAYCMHMRYARYALARGAGLHAQPFCAGNQIIEMEAERLLNSISVGNVVPEDVQVRES